MGYLHIPNLYKDKTILMFKECYALEKIHGTSGHIKWNSEKKTMSLFSGSASNVLFKNLFTDFDKKLADTFDTNIVIYGEVYGGKLQGMSSTYGKEMKFIAFDLNINNLWLNTPVAEKICLDLGIEFVDYVKISTDMESIDAERDKQSTQAVRNGMGEGKPREGVVLKPLVELTLNNGDRVISKHRRSEFRETKTNREVNTEDFKILTDAKDIAEEWVTEMRLKHVLDKLPEDTNIESTMVVLKAMLEDVYREAKGEIVESEIVGKCIFSKTAKIFKQHLQKKLYL